ncbi:MAG: hypothetical protein H7240_10560 [Glaciimonas sp.]|nr:hypothetical protein [Glaciimonas sp.]
MLVSAAEILFSGVMKAVQTYLPTRVSSNFDLLTNICGTLLDAIVGTILRNRFGPERNILHLPEWGSIKKPATAWSWSPYGQWHN